MVWLLRQPHVRGPCAQAGGRCCSGHGRACVPSHRGGPVAWRWPRPRIPSPVCPALWTGLLHAECLLWGSAMCPSEPTSHRPPGSPVWERRTCFPIGRRLSFPEGLQGLGSDSKNSALSCGDTPEPTGSVCFVPGTLFCLPRPKPSGGPGSGPGWIAPPEVQPTVPEELG